MKARPTLILLTLLAALAAPAGGAQEGEGPDPGRRRGNEPAPVTARVGVVATGDYEGVYNQYQPLFSLMSQYSKGQYRRGETENHYLFRLAVGSYDDILEWYRRGYINVALLTPGPIGDLLSSQSWNADLEGLYLASQARKPATSHLAEPDRRAPGLHTRYRAACVVPEGSPLRTFDDLRSAAAESRVRFLFVHPLSASGRILPEYALRQAGINPETNDVTWTYEHAQTVRELSEPDERGRLKVGFVYDDVGGAEGLRRLPLPGLDGEWLPQEVALLHPNFKSHKEDLTKVFLSGRYPTKFERDADWAADYRKVAGWLPAHDERSTSNQQFTLAQIVGKLNSYESNKGAGATRLALVLSGGGAKCAYQLGAIKALENQLEKLKGEDGQRKIDIGLVVGTSGGAINALTTALGVTRTEEGQEALGQVWAAFDQRDFFRPWEPVPTFFALGFGLLSALLIILAVRSFGRERADWWAWSAGLMLGLAVVELVVWGAGWTPWGLLKSFGLRGWANSHSLHHLWLLANLNVWLGAVLHVVFGLGLVAAGRTLRGRDRGLIHYRRRMLKYLSCGAALSAAALALSALFYVKTLSDSAGIEQAFERVLPELINRHTEVKIGPEAGGGGKRSRLREVAHQIMEQKGLRRDLVITGVRLFPAHDPREAEHSPDLYFYYDTQDAREPASADLREERVPPDRRFPADERFVSLAQAPGSSPLLLDVVIGSASIFPIFYPKELGRLRMAAGGEQQVELIDGGFAHNSPIEAAVLWGATHIILVEASPTEKPGREENLLSNSVRAFNYLFSLAQVGDIRSRGKVEVFRLQPSPQAPGDEPNLCLFDFSPDLIQGAVEKGYNDATNVVDPRFQRVRGQPLFY